MSPLKLIVLFLICLCTVACWADIALPIDSVVRESHIKGLTNSSGVQFFSVQFIWQDYGGLKKPWWARGNNALRVQRIKGDTIVNSGRGRYSPGISTLSWDPKLKKLKDGIIYPLGDVNLKMPGDKQDGDCMTISVPNYALEGFTKISSYYSLQSSGKTKQGNFQFYFFPYRRIYECDYYNITTTGSFTALDDFLQPKQKNGTRGIGNYFKLSPTKALDLYNYAKALPDHKFEIKKPFEQILKNPPPIEINREGYSSGDKKNAQPTIPEAKYKVFFQHRRQLIQEQWRSIDTGKYLIALLASILIEFLVIFMLYGVIAKKSFKGIAGILLLLIVVVVSTGITLSAGWWLLPIFLSAYLQRLLIMEVFAVIVEGFCYHKCFRITLQQALLLSVTANFISYLLGVFLFSVIV